MRNPFGVLGLEASADADQVRAAYRKLVKTCHPDKFQDETERKAAQEKMITLNLAYEEAMKLAVNRTTASAAFNRELDQQDALTLAAKMLRQDNPEAALRQLLRASTRDSAWYAMQGKVLMALEQYESAHQSYREAIRREPNNNLYRQGALDAAVALKKSRTPWGRIQKLIRRWKRNTEGKKMKRLLPLLLCAVLALLCATTAQAAGVSITLTASEYALHYAFDAGAQDPFVILEYATPAEKGWMMLYSADGHFEGDVSLAYSGAGGKTSVTLTSARTTGSIGKASTTLPKAADYQKPTGKSNAKVTDFVLTETPEGFHYAFNAAGTDYMLLYWRSKEQTVTQPVYPDENGHYEGDVISDLTFARTQFTVQVKSGSGSMKKEATVRKGYQAPEAPQRQEGRLSGVTVCIDAGHQENGRFVNEPIGPGLSGSTSGKGGMAQGTKTNRRESIVCLEIGMLLRDELLRQGANVIMTREDQTTFHTNIERCEIAEAGGAQIMLRLHCNNSSNRSKRGIQVYGPLNSDYAKAVADADTYREMGQKLLDAMKTRVGMTLANSTGMVRLNDNYVGNNWAKMMCFLVEMGYLSNPAEEYLLVTPVYQQWLAEGMADGVYEIAVARGWVQAQ